MTYTIILNTNYIDLTAFLKEEGRTQSFKVVPNSLIVAKDFTHGSPLALTTLLGVSSAVVDNVPLVQAELAAAWAGFV